MKHYTTSLLLALLLVLSAGCSLATETRTGAQPTSATERAAEPTALMTAGRGEATSAPTTTLQPTEPPTPVLPATAEPTAQPQPVETADSAQMSVPELVESVQGSVVRIIACATEDCQPDGVGTGSGFIIDDEGHIITNNHVIEGARKVTVILPAGAIRRARVIGTDAHTDVALIQVQARNLQVARLGDSSEATVGETVVAIGSALGIAGPPTVSTGVVSALDRTAEEPGGDPTSSVPLYGLIQTDAAVNPGNSGGPLLNLRGEVIGINTLGQRMSGGVPVQGINFAVSIDTARDVVEEILEHGRVTYPYIGIYSRFIYPETVVVDPSVPDVRGQQISQVEPGYPGEEAGLRTGDIIVAIDGERIKNDNTFVRALREHEPGDTITLTILRNGEEIEKEVTLVERPDDA